MKHNVNVETTDNGWSIKWTREDYDRADNYRVMIEMKPRPKTQGCEVFTDKTKLLKRLKELL